MTGLIFAALLTVMVLFFILQLKKANNTMIIEIVKAKSWEKLFYARSQQEKINQFMADYKANPDSMSQKAARKKYDSMVKQLNTYKEDYQRYAAGQKLQFYDMIILFGYRICVMLKLDNESDLLRNVVRSCELSGHIELEKVVTKARKDGEQEKANKKKNSYIYAYYLIATLISYIYVGVAIALLVCIVLPGMGKSVKITAFIAVLSVALMGILGYLPLDELADRAKKRTEKIENEVPNVISKIALLHMSGMTIVNSLEHTAGSGDSLIYKELKLILGDMDKAASLDDALTRLQSRCENKYLDKLVTILLSSDVYGNQKLTEDLLALNAECWLEKKHSVRRYVTAVQAKMQVPTMLMLISILIMVIVPVMEGFM
ncbi:MAG: type II secretion system F family protein [Oscillospiraceae bacterium]|nr:type II secretion system F family protein [Oscillospiraceae bacterium]